MTSRCSYLPNLHVPVAEDPHRRRFDPSRLSPSLRNSFGRVRLLYQRRRSIGELLAVLLPMSLLTSSFPTYQLLSCSRVLHGRSIFPARWPPYYYRETDARWLVVWFFFFGFVWLLWFCFLF